jgi:hypothetical protein
MRFKETQLAVVSTSNLSAYYKVIVEVPAVYCSADIAETPWEAN